MINKHVSGGPYPEKALLQLSWFADAIELAIAGGWNQNLIEDEWYVHGNREGQASFCYPRPSEESVTHIHVFGVIFDHGFAQCAWSDVKINMVNGRPVENTRFSSWQYHLRQMVVSPDPLKYLRDNTQ